MIWESLKRSFKRLPPKITLTGSLFSILIFFVCSLIVAENSVTSSDFLLAKSEAFKMIFECTDINEGRHCFRKYRVPLTKEIQKKYNEAIASKLDDCLSTILKTSNDYSLLLNAQTCFHQADIQSSSAKLLFQSSDSFTWWYLSSTMIAFACQICVSVCSYISTVNNNSVLGDVENNFSKVNKKVNTLDEKLLRSINEIKTLSTNLSCLNINSDTSSQIRIQTQERFRNLNQSISNIWMVISELRDQVSNYDLISSSNMTNTTGTPEIISSATTTETKYADYRKSAEKIHRENKLMATKSSEIRIAKTEPESLWSGPTVYSPTKSIESPKELKASFKGRCFNLSTVEGKNEWYNFVKSNREKRKKEHEQEEKEKNDKKAVSKTEKSSSVDNEEKQISSSLKELEASPKFNLNGRPFRRIFVPNFGWISAKKIEDMKEVLRRGDKLQLHAT